MQLAVCDNIVVEAINLEKDKSKHYICPECGDTVILRKGNINVPHFAHLKNFNCAGCDMTLTHKYAEQILFNAIGKTLILRDIEMQLNNSKWWHVIENIKDEAKILRYPKKITDGKELLEAYPCKNLIIDKVNLEHRYDDVIPDIELISTTDNRLFVEIFVRHRVADIKKQKLENIGVPTIEVDLSFIENKLKNGEVINIKDSIESVLFTHKLYNSMRWIVKPLIDTNYFEQKSLPIITNIIDTYLKFRNKYKFHIFGPDGVDYMSYEEHVVQSLYFVEESLKEFGLNSVEPIEYSYNVVNSLKNDYLCVRFLKDGGQKLEDSDFYIFNLRDNLVGRGYDLENGNIISWDTGEVFDWWDEEKRLDIITSYNYEEEKFKKSIDLEKNWFDTIDFCKFGEEREGVNYKKWF